MGQPVTRRLEEFAAEVVELAATDASQGWLAAVHGAAKHALRDSAPDGLIAYGPGAGTLIDGRVDGRWPAVVGAADAEWLLLPVEAGLVLLRRDQACVESCSRTGGLDGAAMADVTAAEVCARDVHVIVDGGTDLLGLGAAAAVVGSADGVWRRHIDALSARLAITYGGDDVTDDAAAEIARAASEIDAARLQLAASGANVRGCTQAVARARRAVDGLLASSRHALDASDPVTAAWRDVHTGYRIAIDVLQRSDRRR